MAEVNPPAFLGTQSHSVDVIRRAFKILRGQQGIANLGDLAVSQTGTPSMGVSVAAGSAIIDGTQDAVHQGSYAVVNDAAKTLTISASNPTNPRIDLVVAQVQDTEFSGSTDAWQLAIVTGTPAPSPSAPAAPANSIILAQVAVAANATSIVNANITDVRTFEGYNSNPIGTTGVGIGVPNAASGAYIGRWTTPSFGPPAAATYPYIAGMYGYDGAGNQWICTVAGSPGTWRLAAPGLFEVQTLGAAAATVTIPASGSLPTTGRHLRVVIRARGDAIATIVNQFLKFNNDAGANYDCQTITANGTGANPANTESTGLGPSVTGDLPANSAPVNSYSFCEIRIRDYAAAIRQVAHITNTAHVNDATGGTFHRVGTQTWRTAAALTSLVLSVSSGNFIAGSEFTTYIEP